MTPNQIDLHMHSTASDGLHSPSELVNMAYFAGIRYMSLTDHDTVDGLAEAAHAANRYADMVFIPGVEFNCTVGKHRCHILGYGFKEFSTGFQMLLQMGKDIRKLKLHQRLLALYHRGIIFNEEALRVLEDAPSIGRPHLARQLVRWGYANDTAAAMKIIQILPVEPLRIPAQEAIRTIKLAGGVAIWAHPFGGSSAHQLRELEVLEILDMLCQFGVSGIECFHSTHDRIKANMLMDLAERHDLLVSGGSDYHGVKGGPQIGVLSSDDTSINPSWISALKPPSLRRWL